MNKIELRGLSTVSFYADNHEEAKKWYSEILGMDPYFNAPGYSPVGARLHRVPALTTGIPYQAFTEMLFEQGKKNLTL